jgi:hypothetical protein
LQGGLDQIQHEAMLSLFHDLETDPIFWPADVSLCDNNAHAEQELQLDGAGIPDARDDGAPRTDENLD